MKTLNNLRFDHSYARLPENFYQNVEPNPLDNPHLIDFNEDVADLIGLTHEERHSESFLRYMAGHKIPNTQNIAAVYAGHQFGGFSPQLGDGRAILLTEILNPNGSRWDIQLKGAGLTAFSRQGDGRAVLRSSIREYLCSEAMAGLNIPTTRALCLVGSDTEVYREQIETGAMLTRVAPSHVRFGTFEYFYHNQQKDMVKVLADYMLEHHFPDISNNAADKYQQLFHTIVTDTAKLIANWQAVGFAHGVMNTDNMSVLSLTMDYGPFGFLDRYNPEYICNHSDHHGRYAFNQQPDIAQWNLSCLAQAFTALMSVSELKSSLMEYQNIFSHAYADLMLGKFGLTKRNQENAELMQDAMPLLEKNKIDYSIFFRKLSDFNAGNTTLKDDFLDRNTFDQWAKCYLQLIEAEAHEPKQRKIEMDKVNPKYILRNHLAQIAIEKAESGDYSEIIKLREILNKPFDEQDDNQQYAQHPPEWADELEISCSS